MFLTDTNDVFLPFKSDPSQQNNFFLFLCREILIFSLFFSVIFPRIDTRARLPCTAIFPPFSSLTGSVTCSQIEGKIRIVPFSFDGRNGNGKRVQIPCRSRTSLFYQHCAVHSIFFLLAHPGRHWDTVFR